MSVPRILIQPHTHRGHELKPGGLLELRPDQAAWLDGEGVTRPIPAAIAEAQNPPPLHAPAAEADQ